MNVVIIGNSAAGLSGLEAFRKHDQISQVTIIAKEGQKPYSKVLLPYYLRGKVPHEHLFVRGQDYYEQLNATCVNDTVIRLLVEQQCVQLADQTMLPYDKLLIATGSSPIKPPIPGLSGDGVHHLWTLADVGKLKPYYKKGNRVVVLGSGFVSLQGACAALSCGLNVSVIELANRIMPRALDEPGADILAFRMKEMGVDLRVNTLTTHIERCKDKKYKLFFKDGGSLTADFIIVGTGVRPNTDFLEGTTIKIDAGILVNERMETSLSEIYAAGDVAQVPSFAGGDPVVHALWPTAVETGGVAGRCMASSCTPYKGSLNMNVTQMFGLTVASMGNFIEAEGCERWLDESISDNQHMTIVLKGGVPIGATCVGSSELVSTLGMLRPLIREKVRIAGKPEMLKAMMAQNISHHHDAFVK
jgi:nitrite reductase (NADH) large subunit